MDKNRLHLFELGGGRAAFLKDLTDSLEGAFSQNLIVLLPNRVMKQSIQEEILLKKGGYMGLTFLSFDEFVQDMTLQRKNREDFILPYLLREKMIKEADSFPNLSSVLPFLSTSERLIQFYRQALEKGEEDFSSLPLPYITELERGYFIFQNLLKERKMIIPEILYKRGYEELDSIHFSGKKFFLFGFSSFRNREWSYMEKIIERGGQFTVYYPFGRQEEYPLTIETINRFEKNGFEIIECEETRPSPQGRFFWTLRNGALYERIFEEVAKLYEAGESLSEMAILTTTEEECNQLLVMAQSYHIPVSHPREDLSSSLRQLILELRRSFLHGDSTKEDVLLHVKSRYLTVFDSAQEFLQILEKLDFTTFLELKKFMYGSQNSSLSSEEYDLFRDNFEILEKEIEKCKESHPEFLRGMVSFCKYRLSQIQWESLSDFEEGERVLLHETLEKMEDLSQSIGKISEEEFFLLLTNYLEEPGGQTEPVKGLSIMTLSESLGLDFTHLFLINLNKNFPPQEKFHFLKNMSHKKELNDGSYFLDDKHREEEMTLLFLYHVAQAQSVYFTRYGEENDQSYLYSQFLLEMKGEEETAPKENIRPIYNFVKEKFERGELNPLPLEGLEGEAREDISRQLMERTYSATQLDRYISCPYRYFVDEFLLQDLSLEDKDLERAKEIGIIYHTILEDYFKNEGTGESISTKVEDEFSKRHRRELFTEWEIPFYQEEMTDFLLAYLKREEALHGNEKEYLGFQPCRFEEKFRMTMGPYQFTGTIDRIDRNERGEEWIVDYKKNRAPSLLDYEEGKSFQLSLYGYYRNTQGHPVVGMGYGSLEQGRYINILRNEEILGKFPRFTSPHGTTEEIERYFETLPEKIFSVIEEMKEGVFPPIPKDERNCTYCPYLAFCRKEDVA